MKKMSKIFYGAIAGCTAVAIAIIAFNNNENIWFVVPLYISLIVVFFQAQVNKYAYLLGGINSILYAVVHACNTLYATAAYSLLASAPLQFITFINWRNNSYEKSTVFKKMNIKEIMIYIMGNIALFALIYKLFSRSGSEYLLLDSITTTLGITITLLCSLRFLEYTILTPISTSISIVTYIIMLHEKPIMAAYITYSIYSLICVTIAAYKVIKLYNKQQKEKCCI